MMDRYAHGGAPLPSPVSPVCVYPFRENALP
jgi:hypothetical protein